MVKCLCSMILLSALGVCLTLTCGCVALQTWVTRAMTLCGEDAVRAAVASQPTWVCDAIEQLPSLWTPVVVCVAGDVALHVVMVAIVARYVRSCRTGEVSGNRGIQGR